MVPRLMYHRDFLLLTICAGAKSRGMEFIFTFGAENLRIAEERRRVADVFRLCFRQFLVRVYEHHLRGQSLQRGLQRVINGNQPTVETLLRTRNCYAIKTPAGIALREHAVARARARSIAPFEHSLNAKDR